MENITINQITTQLAPAIAEKVSSEIDFKIALIGLLGVIVGILGQGAIEWIRGCPKRAFDKTRSQLLKSLLNDEQYAWREIGTLARIIGADESETKRLLIELGARGSEKEKDVWALISRQPLDKTQK